MQRLEVSGAVRPIYRSLGIKRLMLFRFYFENSKRKHKFILWENWRVLVLMIRSLGAVTIARFVSVRFEFDLQSIYIVDEWKTNLMTLAILFHLLCAQHVSDINISIFRSLRLCWWITTSVVLFSVRCVLEILVQASACKTNTTKGSNTQRTENKTTDVVIHQHSSWRWIY